MRKFFKVAVAGVLIALATIVYSAQRHAMSTADRMAQAATDFLQCLTPEQRAQATFPFDDDERFNWHFIPRERKGLPFKDLDPAQGLVAHALVASGQSVQGYRKALHIMSLEKVLARLEDDYSGRRDPEKYYLSVFGTPGGDGAWGWRLEGHHLSLNFTVVNGAAVASTPHFLGSNPQKIPDGPRAGFRTLAAEEDLGRALFQSLNAQQQATARFADTAPRDIFTSADREVMLEKPIGLNASQMTPDQQQKLQRLIEEYAANVPDDLAAQRLTQMQAGLWDGTWFAWAGPDAVGAKHYYQVRGPAYLIEYDNTQNNGNHVHAVWRDPADDFGRDLLKEHYQQNH